MVNFTGFSIKAQNNTFELATPDASKFYCVEIVPQIAVKSVLPLQYAEIGAAIQTLTYFDGLGRQVQVNSVGQGGNGEDIVKYFEYGQNNRLEKEYLPFAIETNGEFLSDPKDSLLQFYSQANSGIPMDSVPYSRNIYDNSPLRRIINAYGPGADWKTNDKKTTTTLSYSLVTDAVRKWQYDSSDDMYKSTSFYDEGALLKTIVTDENGNPSTTFVDRQGLLILSIKGDAKTYYIYDKFSRLIYTIQPEGLKVLAKNENNFVINWNKPEIRNLCFKYEYDNNGRITTKWVPGISGEIYYVYDRLGRVVMAQNPKLRLTNQWSFIKRDALGREILSGLFTTTISRSDLQTLFDSETSILYETRNISGIMGYTNNSYPAISENDVYIANYYDTYTVSSTINPKFKRPSEGFSSIAVTGNTKDMLTVSRRRIINSSVFLTSAAFYDEKGRVLQIQSDNIKGKTDIVTYNLDYSGKVTNALTQHYSQTSISDSIKIKNFITYDQANRIKYIDEEIVGDATGKVTLAEMNYNALGQLKEKNIHKKTDGSFLQSIDYKYNIRGWLTAINNPESSDDGDLFGMSLTYNEGFSTLGGESQYNGLISGIKWQVFQGTHTGLRGYGFTYDNNYRLTYAKYGEGSSFNSNSDAYSEYGITYDDNGNILTLNRKGLTTAVNATTKVYGQVDQLQYIYSGNQLQNVTDGITGITNDENFIDSLCQSQEYVYDEMGNMTSDLNKQISSVTYNYLNLPQTVAFTNGSHIDYTYDAVGTKLSKLVYNSSNTLIGKEEYVGNIIYQDNVLSSMATSEGRIEFNSFKNATYQYYLRDHLGNIRVVFKQGSDGLAQLVQENHYYPFGMNMSGLTTGDSKYRFGGKEYQDELGVLWYDFGARNYDAQLGRWFNIDPLAEKFYIDSPYSFCINNPVNLADPTGMGPVRFDWFAGEYYNDEDGDGKRDQDEYSVSPQYAFATYDICEGGSGCAISLTQEEIGAFWSVIKYNPSSLSCISQNNGLFIFHFNNSKRGSASEVIQTWVNAFGNSYLIESTGSLGSRVFSNVTPGAFYFQNNTAVCVAWIYNSISQSDQKAALSKNPSGQGGYNFGRINNAFSLAGLGWGINELAVYNDNFWLGKNLKYYSKTWKYGNQWTGTSLEALKNAKLAKILGRVAFGVNFTYGLYSVYSGVANENYSKATFSGLGTIYSGIATFGSLPGMLIAGPLVLIDATIGLDNYLQNAVNTEIDRGDRISRGDYSIWAYPKFGQSYR